MGRFYKRFIEPQQHNEDTRNRELVLNVLVAGTIVLFGLAFLLLLVSIFGAHNWYVATRAVVTGAGLLAAVITYYLSRSGRHTAAAYLLLGLYGAITVGTLYRWGATVPTGLLLLGLLVVLSGIVLGARAIPWTFGLIVVVIGVVRALELHSVIHSDLRNWTAQPLGLGTVVGCCLLFGILATVSWLYTSQMERSLQRARRAEAALIRQKDLLEVTVERRTRQLQAAQFEKVQQMYRFAELGQLSTALMHDLANHLTTLGLDIEGLEEDTRSSALKRAKRSIHYIDDMVGRVRDQLHGRAEIRPFSVAPEIDEIVSLMSHRAHTSAVHIVWEAPANKKALRIVGEPIRFRQMLANLVGNAIDAYPDKSGGSPREVVITTALQGEDVVVTVNDWGRGILPADRAKLFDAFFSTKKTGMGMGLFMAKQIVEEHFHGRLALDDTQTHTAFVVAVPRK
ncbi:MAG TPA: HAMP domain-containing sensor histidine kinase [Candidatus Saccharimonadales bacterium]|nr:HAMP domain-containing sensor histidine kinase [Candidatus Saccharimonadales bacterium]